MIGAPALMVALIRMIEAPTLVAHLATIRSPLDNAAGRYQHDGGDDSAHGKLTECFHCVLQVDEWNPISRAQFGCASAPSLKARFLLSSNAI
jgi:hypothetical protein